MTRLSGNLLARDKNKAVQTVKDRILAGRAKQPVIFHGQLTGNMDVTIPQLLGKKGHPDGSVNLPEGVPLSEDSGTPIFRGHPVIHASVSGGAGQPEPERLGKPPVHNENTVAERGADFHLSRNASLNSDIKSDNSHITLEVTGYLWIK